ncbi:hypothetical protein Mal15_04310 [Stieleria maiorica]|uniref:Uncharacterized protein n=1 Tax=Stieleria maiorica TaxID=2795974 RepID=A0A5B9M6W5_9BACT|nr:hypothetical protein Mal15_04310 [Stieleria maiorica]
MRLLITCALGARTLRRHWEDNDRWGIAACLRQAAKDSTIKEPTPGAGEAQFDSEQSQTRGILRERLPGSSFWGGGI